MAVTGGSSEEGLIEQLAPAAVLFGTAAAGPGQILLGVVARIHERDHLEAGAPALECDQKENALGIEGRVEITTFRHRSDPVEHPEGGVVEITLSAHVAFRA
jgi:hypothetical protein